MFYIGVVKRLLTRIRRMRPEYCEKVSSHLLADNSPAHQSTLIIDFFTKNGILIIINHSPYSPDLAPCGLFLLGKLHLAMKGKGYAVIEDIQRSTTAILNIIPSDKIKMFFDSLFDRAESGVLSPKGTILNKIN